MGTSQSVDGRAPIHTFYSSKAWIEGNAVRQLECVAALPGVTAVAAMPDLHVGKYGPVGCSVLAEAIHPQLIGADIGCGMGLFQLDVAVRKLRLDVAADRLAALEGASHDSEMAALPALAHAGCAASPFNASIGTVGGGNHLREVQAVDEVFDEVAAKAAGLDRERAVVLVHSGSRGLGYSILQQQLADGATPLDPAEAKARGYLGQHDSAVMWARVNRHMIAQRAAVALRTSFELIADVGHNFVEVRDNGALHRKGTAAADRGLVAIPGSRGTLSYLVAPLAAGRAETLASLAHGAGRKFDRGSMHGRVRAKKSDLAVLSRNPFGGYVVCEDRNLLIEEAPEAYKGIDRVIGDLEDLGLARVVATFRPLVTFKTARGAERHEASARPKRGGGRDTVREDWR
jgi:release factor H-coupled RctB family protein